MTHGSLFSGIGGFDLAAEWMGWQNVFHCEVNPFAQRHLKYYWPNAISYNDITKTDFTIHRGSIDLITGGFPCQPYSGAGKRLGKEDERHLWPEMLRAIREIQPRWVVGENVLGLVNWSRGLVFHEVQADLETEGYEVQPFVLPAISVNAPHRRDRVFFVAYANGIGRDNRCDNRRKRQFPCNKERDTEKGKSERDQWFGGIGEVCSDGNTSHSDGIRLRGESDRIGDTKFFSQDDKKTNWETFPTVSPICDGDDGISNRLDGITFSKWRQESIKAGGNAVVPQVVLQIFKTIAEYEKLIIQRPSI